jgi:hypothetical protein
MRQKSLSKKYYGCTVHEGAIGMVVAIDHYSSAGGSVEQQSAGDDLALFVCRQLYEHTDGRQLEWRRPVGGGESVRTAVEYGVDHGWLLFDARRKSICLTDEGRRRVRKTFS